MGMLGGKLLEVVPQQRAFWLANGTSVTSLRELAKSLKGLDPVIFKHHVNEVKNDFYTWVKDVYQHQELAADVLACEDGQKMAECVEHWVELVEKEQRARYWEGVQGAQQHVHTPRLKIQRDPQDGQPSPDQGITPKFEGILGFDMRRITKVQLPSEAEGVTPIQKSTMFKYAPAGGEKVVKKIETASDQRSILRQLKEVYRV